MSGLAGYNTGHYFCREMERLNQAGIPVYLPLGNHDADSEMIKIWGSAQWGELGLMALRLSV